MVSSKFSRRPVVQQPPPVCKKPWPPFPFPLTCCTIAIIKMGLEDPIQTVHCAAIPGIYILPCIKQNWDHVEFQTERDFATDHTRNPTTFFCGLTKQGNDILVQILIRDPITEYEDQGVYTGLVLDFFDPITGKPGAFSDVHCHLICEHWYESCHTCWPPDARADLLSVT